MAAMDEAERAQRAAEREEWRVEREFHEQIDGFYSQLDNTCIFLMKDALEGAGFHQHHRGAWRKRRVPQEGNAP